MPDGQVVFEISADGKKAYAAIDDVTEALSKAGKKWESSAAQSTDAIGNKFTSMFKKIGVAALAMKAGKALLDLGKDAIEAASDLQEVQNVVDVTFGAGANQIEAWAKTAGTQFGLTELQAKRFTSTLGAMMKSSGLAGEEIIGMSTDLAGLAADMASFYNLDFDTAFQKIRSGISGETEPLKQLGINMSVVNLEAYAMTQGITKAFNEMSQGEQTMLRYQYLMQATADAQGDFARTSSTSFANMKRQLQTNLQTISASIGSYLIGPMQEATSALAGFLSELAKEKPRTVLDEFADINLDTEGKLADINNTAEQARLLLGILEEINTNTGLDTDSNTLKFIRTLTTDINELDTATGKQGTITGNITDLAGGLNPTVDGDGKLSGSIGGIIESIGGLETKLGDNQIESGLGELAGDLNPPVDKTISGAVNGVKIDIEGLENKLGNNTVKSGVDTLAGELDPPVNEHIGDTLGEIEGAVDQFAGKLKNNDVDENMGTFVPELDPAVNKSISDTLGGIEGDIDAFGNKLENSGVKASMGVLEGELNPTVKAHIGGTLAGIEEDIDGFTGKLADSGVEAGMAQLEKELNPTIEETTPEKKIGEVEGRIAGLVTTLGENGVEAGMSKLAADMNPTVQDGFKDAVDDLTGSIGDLKQAAGDTDTIEQNISDVAGAINELPGDTSKGAALEAIADGANKLQLGQAVAWRSMYNVLKNIDGLSGIFNDGAANNVGDLATALSTDAPAEDKAAVWKTFLDALGSNAGALNALTGKDAQGAKEWLQSVSGALDDASLDPNNVDAWAKLLSTFSEGMSEENKGKFTDTIVDELLAMGNKSEYARQALLALGYESDDIAQAQQDWLTTCQRLVKTLPGLSSIIDSQTGEVKGGADAVRAYIEEWQTAQEKAAMWAAVEQKKTALNQAFADLPGLKLDAAVAKRRARMALEDAKEIFKEYGARLGKDAATGKFVGDWSDIYGLDKEQIAELKAALKELNDAYADAEEKMDIYADRYNAAVEAEEALAEYEETVIENYGELGDAAEGAARSMTLLEKAANDDADAMASVESAVQAASDALQDLADYQEKIRQETEQTVQSVVKGFDKVETPMTKARNELASLKQAWKDAGTAEEKAAALEKWEQAKNKYDQDKVSIHSMTENLRTQLKFMQQYQAMLTQARAKGVSEDILATLSDGSQESFDYLYALTQYSGNIDELNDMYAQVQKEAEGFTNTLTDQKLAVDEEYKSLLALAQEAVDGLNLSEEAYTGVSDTLDAILKACGDKSEAIQTAVDNIVSQMDRLSNLGAGGWFNNLGKLVFRNNSFFSYGSQANGMDYVPYDGYLALLHQGERVQTAAEADLSRRYSYQQPSFDYTAMGGAIGANIGRGNVYLDGRVVGELMSARQANSYRALERSGWQG